MKIKVFCVLVLSVLLGSGFTSCSKDKESEDYARTIAGTYKGVLHIANMPDVENVTIEITRSDVNRVTLKMNETVLFLPINISCESAVVYSDQKYAVSGAATFDMPAETGAIPIPVTISGTIDKNSAASLKIKVEIPGAAVEVTFEGGKQ